VKTSAQRYLDKSSGETGKEAGIDSRRWPCATMSPAATGSLVINRRILVTGEYSR